jgi:hypothetical protein
LGVGKPSKCAHPREVGLGVRRRSISADEHLNQAPARWPEVQFHRPRAVSAARQFFDQALRARGLWNEATESRASPSPGRQRERDGP